MMLANKFFLDGKYEQAMRVSLECFHINGSRGDALILATVCSILRGDSVMVKEVAQLANEASFNDAVWANPLQQDESFVHKLLSFNEDYMKYFDLTFEGRKIVLEKK
jgi:hypothetical protein